MNPPCDAGHISVPTRRGQRRKRQPAYADDIGLGGRELELIAGAHPGDTVVTACHQASILAATRHFPEATYSRAHVSMEVDHTAITEWQLRPLDPEASGGGGLRWVLRRANDAEHPRPPLRGVTRRRRHS
ncbi:hypothetical protein ACW9HK_30530 [Nocardia gipuzkoensis]